MPEREIPGIMAILWARPKTTASLIFNVSLSPDINFLVRIRIIPVITRAPATRRGESNRLSKKSFPLKPMSTVIKVATNKNASNLIFLNIPSNSLKKKTTKARPVPKCKTTDIAS